MTLAYRDNTAAHTTAEGSLTERLRTRSVRVSVVGQGYVGLPLAVELGRVGFSISGLDTSPDRIAALNAGHSHTPDVDGHELAALREADRYTATADFATLSHSDVVIICVPTPLRKSKDPDISYVLAAATETAAHFRPGQLVILESTTYPGTTEELLLPLFEARGAVVGENFFLAFSPERIDPGNRNFRLRDIPKVVGGVTPACSRLAALLYRQIVDKVVEVSSPKVAELAKLYENVFRNVNIALANEFALMCRRLDVNSREVIEAAATKPFGFLPFYPGPGIGGHCIPIDPGYLAWKMRLNGYEARFIHLADDINRAMPVYVVSLVTEELNKRRRAINGARILVLGVAYKRGIGDTRESPALEVLADLRRKGAEISYADPYVPSLVIDGTVFEAIELTDARLTTADCVLILTDHPEFDYRRVVARASLVVDTRNATWGIPSPAGRVVVL
ncbi:MAG: UDP-N-acetyl-D-glucosamine dehydrogenase [Armatimonadetes bacterium 13_1_40CM_64_14]|nr:MAG: UDP-N-acetyl-D-glucosamine dehydrogenase [Armatimonadetes bacterium 13_1_40CM_64_14]